MKFFVLSLLLLLCGACDLRNGTTEVDQVEIAEDSLRLSRGPSKNDTEPAAAENSGMKIRSWRWPELSEVDGEFRSFSRGLHLLAPGFVLSPKKTKSERCKRDTETYLRQLEDLKLWALKMYDSSGKITSGILNGNINQFGDFDQCLSAEEPHSNIRGRYCLAYFQVKPRKALLEREEIRRIYDLMQSHHSFRSEMSDPGHRVPRFSTINWAFCMPSSCTHEDLEEHLKESVRSYGDGLGFDVQVRVDPEMCHIRQPFEFSSSFLTVSFLFIFAAAVVAASTVRDLIGEGNGGDSASFFANFLHCFSLRRNVKQLMSTEAEAEDIKSVHGIRMINALLLLLSHKSMALFFYPYSNRTHMVEVLSKQWTILARMASLYTDSFIMISGILTSYSFIKTLRKTGKLDLKSEYLNRSIRIFPLLAVTVLLSTVILPELGSGPQWGLTVDHHSNSCKNSWWKNFLFVHNYFGFENMCLTHTHHIGIDTQLFLVSPILVYVVHKWQKPGLAFLALLALASTGLRYYFTLSRNLSYFIYPGSPVRQMIDTANYSYIIPSHRLTVYVMGLIAGYILRHCGRDYRMKSHTKRTGWMLSLSLLCFVISKATNMSHLGYRYDSHEAAVYSAVAPIAWCLFLFWIIFASHMGYGGLSGRILSSKCCIIWTRISYAVYLIQFPIFFYNVGRQRYSQEFSLFSLVSVTEYSSILFASVLLTLFFDMPFGNLKRLLRKRRSLAKRSVDVPIPDSVLASDDNPGTGGSCCSLRESGNP